MRHVVAMLGLLLIVLPAFASVETTFYDYGYQVFPNPDQLGIRVDWVAQAIFITTKAVAPVDKVGEFARESAHDLALEAARGSIENCCDTLRLTGYASVNEAIFTGYLPPEVKELAGKAVRPVVENWDADTRTITLVSVLPLCGPGSPNVIAARMLAVEQQAFAGQDQVRLYKSVNIIKSRAQAAVTQLSAGPYTGVIVDCTKMHYTPVLLPKLVAANGNVCWGLKGISPDAIIEKGLVGYANGLPQAIASARAGDHPYIVRPLGTAGPLQADTRAQ